MVLTFNFDGSKADIEELYKISMLLESGELLVNGENLNETIKIVFEKNGNKFTYVHRN